MENYCERDYVVRTYECDNQYRAKLSSLVNYMQDMAGVHSGSVGLGAEEMIKMNLAWVLYKWKIRIYQYPKLNSTVRVRTWSSHMDKMHAHRCFILYDEKGTVIGEALSVWVMLDFAKRAVCPIPPAFLEVYPSTEETVPFSNEFTNNPLPLADTLLSQCDFTIQRHDLDYNRHVNNVKYIDFLLDTIPEELLAEKQIYDLEVVYKKEFSLGDSLTCLCFDSVKKEEGTTIVSLIKPSGEENNRRAHTFFQVRFK